MRILAAIVALSLAACSGQVVADAATTDGGARDTGATTSVDAASAPCVRADAPAPFHPPTCDDLAVMTLSAPKLEDDGGDGSLSPGERGRLKVMLHEVAGEGFNAYPVVKFTSDHPGVTVTDGEQLYAVLACTSTEQTAKVTVASDVAPGTVAHVRARVGMLGADCPDAFAITIPLVIR